MFFHVALHLSVELKDRVDGHRCRKGGDDRDLSSGLVWAFAYIVIDVNITYPNMSKVDLIALKTEDTK